MNVTFRNVGFEYSIESILLFQTEDTNSYWSDSLYYFYPEINQNIQALQEREKEDYLRATLQKVWDRVLPEIEAKECRYHEHFQKYRNQIEDALSDAFELDSRTMFNELLANITLNPICPRFLREEKFDLFYMNSERGALGITLHEVIHYFWFFVWNRHFQDSYDEYETPSLQWILSEMVVESIMSDKRLSTINPYYPREEGACVYRYFLDMKITLLPPIWKRLMITASVMKRKFGNIFDRVRTAQLSPVRRNEIRKILLCKLDYEKIPEADINVIITISEGISRV